MNHLKDPFGRIFNYLRLSITPACNFRCTYCLPAGFNWKSEDRSNLTNVEIKRLCLAFAELGFWKVRITGGEPTVRKDVLQIAETISSTPGVSATALSTNGFRLNELAHNLYHAGISAINISLDSLNRHQFHQITGHDKMLDVLRGVDKSIELGFSTKINTVLLKGVNENEIDNFIDFVKKRPISIRFVELMETESNEIFFNRHHISSKTIQKKIEANGWRLMPKRAGTGPALEFFNADYRGTIGIISPYSKNFCSTCNRLRVTSNGSIRLCLFGNSNLNIRHLLDSDHKKPEIKETIRNVISQKGHSHFLKKGNYGDTYNLSTMGG